MNRRANNQPFDWTKSIDWTRFLMTKQPRQENNETHLLAASFARIRVNTGSRVIPESCLGTRVIARLVNNFQAKTVSKSREWAIEFTLRLVPGPGLGLVCLDKNQFVVSLASTISKQSINLCFNRRQQELGPFSWEWATTKSMTWWLFRHQTRSKTRFLSHFRPSFPSRSQTHTFFPWQSPIS